MPSLRLYRVGHSTVITVPRAILEQLNLLIGDELLMQVENGRLVLTPLQPHSAGPSCASQTDRRRNRAVSEDEP